MEQTISNATKRVVVTFDARYHGDSPSVGEFTYETMAQDVFNLARHLGMEKFSVMGHSMGGKTAMTFALLYPSHVEKLVSIDVSPLEQSYLPTTKFDYLSALQQVVIQSEQSPMTLLQAKTLADNALKELGCEATNRNHLVANFVSKDSKIVWAGTPDLDLVRQSFPVLRAFPKGLLTREFKQPTLFMKCENSSYIPYSTFPEIQETFVNAKFGIIHNSGHFPHIENTTQFMDVLLEFLNSN
ncbi:Alpha/beta hydrolase domain-containing protein 11 [Orchesella cincta]|uniref:sn-1-specific diacylglycerol lipase ABHD11 n=1 Tax=Orchesella cincta TaxID=48709 RepID=A0A1D2MIP6_ORCCI|nr:Alpha/beta hydrolase domain-containing protein 11 [Orchesella cincta]